MRGARCWRTWSTLTKLSLHLPGRPPCPQATALRWSRVQSEPSWPTLAPPTGNQRRAACGPDLYLQVHSGGPLAGREPSPAGGHQGRWTASRTVDIVFQVIYVEGYFLSHSPEATMELARCVRGQYILYTPFCFAGLLRKTTLPLYSTSVANTSARTSLMWKMFSQFFPSWTFSLATSVSSRCS